MKRLTRLSLWILIGCLPLSSCTLEHSRENSYKLLQNADLVATHSVQRSTDWALSPRARLCHGSGASDIEPADQLEAHWQQVIDRALYQALRQSFQVQAVAFTEPGILTTDSGAVCELLVQARLVSMGDEVELHGRHGPERAGSSLPGRMIVRVTLTEVATGRLLDLSLVRSRAGALTPVADWLDSLADDAMAAYVARITASGPRV